ncbi:hypothetical protein ACFYYS_03090 [Streptomyces sp. NPDC002120]|uniref:hypothetical protein n=1 Tax=Streptomyces sp. NPDC002120 TaxID=3364631 RepID=UPI0036AAA23D
MELRHTDRVTFAGRTILRVEDPTEYAGHAQAVDEKSSPLPVLAAVWDRFVDSCTSLPTGPGATTDLASKHWRGTVFVCDEEYAAVGEVLARATARPLQTGTFAEAAELSRTTPVTMVVGSGQLGPKHLAAIPVEGQLGLFVTRSPAAASALAVRNVLNGPAAAALGDVFVDALSPEDSAPGRLSGPDATPARLRGEIGDGVAILTGRGHARDCVMHLNGGGICGRSEDQPLLSVLPPLGDGYAEHPTACQQGGGCWRGDVAVERHMRASQVRAAFVMLDSCRTAVVGSGAVRTDVSIPLTMLEGATLSVVVAAGVRGGCAHAGQLFQALIRSGFPLGLALSETNGAIAAERDGLGKLVLFGDAGLIPAPTIPDPSDLIPCPVEGNMATMEHRQGAVLLETSHELIAAVAQGPLVVPRLQGGSSWVLTQAAGRGGGKVVTAPPHLGEAWLQRALPWLNHLRALGGQGLKPDRAALDGVHHKAITAVRERAQATDAQAAQKAITAFESALAELAAAQKRLVADETEWVSTSFYSTTESWPLPWLSYTEPDLRACSQCGTQAAVCHRIRTAAGVGLPLHQLVCVRCGEVEAGADDFAAQVTAHAPPEVRRGSPFTVRIEVSALPDRPVAIALGAAIVGERILGCTLASTLSFQLAPGERKSVEITGTSDASQAKPDLQPVKILIAADGAVRCLTRNVWLRV